MLPLSHYKSSAVAEMVDRGHNRHGLKIVGRLCPFGDGELDPHLTQCCQGRGLPACQVSSQSIQPFGHNTPMSQTDRLDRQWSDSIGWTVLQTVTQQWWFHWQFGETCAVRWCVAESLWVHLLHRRYVLWSFYLSEPPLLSLASFNKWCWWTLSPLATCNCCSTVLLGSAVNRSVCWVVKCISYNSNCCYASGHAFQLWTVYPWVCWTSNWRISQHIETVTCLGNCGAEAFEVPSIDCSLSVWTTSVCVEKLQDDVTHTERNGAVVDSRLQATSQWQDAICCHH